MIWNILKKDLKRKKTMNTILLLFVILATMFVASSIDNIVTVANGTEYYFEKAGLGDYIVLTMGENSVGKMDPMLSKSKAVKDYRLEDFITVSEDKITIDGEKIILRNTGLIQSLEDAKLNFFDADNKKVTGVEKGKVYLTSDTLQRNGLAVGDKIRIRHSNVDMTLEVAGKLKDALLGSTFMGNTRIFLNREDYKVFEEDEELSQYFSGQVCYINTDDVEALKSELSEVDGIAFDGDKGLIRMCYVMDMVVAGILLVVSICLIIVAFLVLKFTITFTLMEEFREIGVMKAIGIRDFKIRSIYLTKYFAIALCGALIGFFLSIPFSKMLISSVSENMVIGNDSEAYLHMLSTVLVILVIVAYAFRCTSKVKKFRPMDAIRSGQTGERYHSKAKYRLSKSRRGTTTYMAINDVLSSPKRYLTMILTFALCSLLVFILVNTTETMTSDSLVSTFAKPSDAYYTDVDKVMGAMSGDGHQKAEEALQDVKKKLSDNGMDADVSVDVQYKYKLEYNGKENKYTFQQGIHTKADEYEYYEGSAPQNANEIAITEPVADEIGAHIGDTVSVTVGDKTEDYLITAYFQSMNQLGKIIRLHEDVPTDLRDSASMMAFQIDFKDQPSQNEIDERVKKMRDVFETEDIYSAAEYCADCIGVVDMMEAVEMMLLLITGLVIILVTILMERSFVSDESSEIAILKAIGFSDGAVMAWHIKRFVIVGVIAVAVAVALSVPMTSVCITPVFRMMGMKSVSYVINPLQVFLLFPGIILAITFLAAALTACFTKSIKSADTAGLE